MSAALSARAALLAGIAAGVVSTVAQMAMWVAFTNAFPSILWRDTRFAAAIVLGGSAIGDGFSLVTIAAVATLVHFVLSIAYAAVLGIAIRRLGPKASLLAGALFGAIVYGVNMHLFTALFPWFVETRDAITLAAHLVFGITAAFVYRRLEPASRRR